ncbi:hypothetical protein GON26_01375 [Flavobacterium sp. GA093]|uniref:Uncharacterized protein n=1 Tax=Flavobacterium hydrocarbonoxydans TaxID=2683249 RepID=A0A6I4NEN8_9FLAO|nr:hypothetical protein [Flavobacterium hydrocarbonoxydans]MWB93000.1 hypothetical protein [Flavobacterium hydrocarbonoxydans]
MLLTKTIFGRSKYIKVSDPHAQAFVIAIKTKSNPIANAVNQLCIDLKAANLWNKMQCVYPFVDTSEFAHKFNLLDPRDSDDAFRISFGSPSGLTSHSALGFVSGNQLANTHFIPSIVQNVFSNGITIVCGTHITGDVRSIGAYMSTTQASVVSIWANPYFVSRMNGSNIVYGNTDSKGIYTAQRVSSTVSNQFRTGVKVTTSNSGGVLPTIPLYIASVNENGLQKYPDQKRTQSTYIHEGMTDSEVVSFHTIINTFENSLSRKTW